MSNENNQHIKWNVNQLDSKLQKILRNNASHFNLEVELNRRVFSKDTLEVKGDFDDLEEFIDWIWHDFDVENLPVCNYMELLNSSLSFNMNRKGDSENE